MGFRKIRPENETEHDRGHGNRIYLMRVRRGSSYLLNVKIFYGKVENWKKKGRRFELP